MTYHITYTSGVWPDNTVATYDDAICLLADRWPELKYGHDGDLTSGGDRTLVWATESDSVDDDGARAVAVIRREDD